MHYIFEFVAIAILFLMILINLLGVAWLQLSKSFLAEVAESFPLQIIIFSTLLAFLVTIFLFAISPIGFLTILNILSLIPALILLVRVLHFSYSKEHAEAAGTKNNKLRVGSFNKQIGTKNAHQIVTYAHELELDILGISEVKSSDFKQLKASGYKYSFHTNKKYGLGQAEFFIMSRFKLSSIEGFSLDKFGNGLRCEIAVNEKKIAVYLIHTTAPISPELYNKRNEGFVILADKLGSESLKYIAMFGDLNITPFSWAYRRFIKSIGARLYNVTRGRGIIFTWVYFKPFFTHLDHIFATKNMSTLQFKKGKNLNSDHNLIWAEFEF